MTKREKHIPSLTQEEYIRREQEINELLRENPTMFDPDARSHSLYFMHDWMVLPGYHTPAPDARLMLRSLEDLLDKDKKREEDGFTRRIRLGKIVKPGKGKKSKVVIVPSTTEPKFYHDDSITDEDSTGGSGEGEEGEVIGKQKAQPQQGEGEGQGAGQGGGESHEEGSDVYDLGKILTEKFQLPNIKPKGSKRSLTKITYDLTDRNRGFGQLLEKKATIKRIVETNIQLGNILPGEPVDTSKLIISPDDLVYRIMSAEMDFENQAIVFFVRDYSGSMQGKPTEAIATQHLFIYSWLMYQFSNNVVSRFIVHDTEAKEVDNFQQYYQLQVAGGTRVAPAFAMVNKIIQTENLARDYNIYVFYGTDGDDWDSDGKELNEELNKLLPVVSRIGITVSKNSWTGENETTVEKNIAQSGIAQKRRKEFRIDGFNAETADETRIIESIKKLVSE
ncbi:MAG TPA: hypothetical protein DHV29_11845 [Bacteroidales bacterium]|nr:hypothetical protein [Bacteroidales bacterium]HCY24168.1 hypothetical protein [Bacteroidales bacterium]